MSYGTIGPLYPGTVTVAATAASGQITWTTPTAIYADDTTYAGITSASFDAGTVSYMMYAQTFGGTVPANGVNLGIVLEIGKYDAAGDGRDAWVQLINGTALPIGDNKANTATSWPSSVGTITYGSSTDDWGIGTLTPTLANGTAFGVRFMGSAASPNTDIFVDFIRLLIYYDIPLWTINPAEATQDQASDEATANAITPITIEEATQAQTSDAASVSFSAPASAPIISIDHSTGDLTQYTSTVTDSGDLSVAAGAALAGSDYGLSCLIDDTTAIYGVKTFTGVTHVRARFYVDPNTIANDSTTNTIVLCCFYNGGISAGYVQLYIPSGGGYGIRVALYSDPSTRNLSSVTTISDAPHYIEFEIVRATGSSSNDGYLDWWIDGTSQTRLSGFDNYDVAASIDSVRMGGVVLYGAPTGTFYLDELVVNDTGTEIGPVSGGVTNIAPAEATQSQTSDAVAINAFYPLVVAEATQAQTSDAAVVSPLALQIIGAESNQTQSSDAAVLSFIQPITAGEATQSQTGDPGIATAIYPLVASQSTQAQLSDAASLSILLPGVTNINPAEATQSQTSEAAVLTFTGPTYQIAASEATQSQTSDAAVLSFGLTVNITVSEATQSQTSDAATLSTLTPITVSEASQTQTSDAASISFSGIGVTNITVGEASQSQTSDPATLGVIHRVVVSEAAQTQTSDAAVITFTGPTYQITPGKATQAQTSDAAVVRAITVINVAQATQTQTVDPAILIMANLILHGTRRIYTPNTRGTNQTTARGSYATSTRQNQTTDTRNIHYVNGRDTEDVDD